MTRLRRNFIEDGESILVRVDQRVLLVSNMGPAYVSWNPFRRRIRVLRPVHPPGLDSSRGAGRTGGRVCTLSSSVLTGRGGPPTSGQSVPGTPRTSPVFTGSVSTLGPLFLRRGP